jgi:hypothetical protein
MHVVTVGRCNHADALPENRHAVASLEPALLFPVQVPPLAFLDQEVKSGLVIA